MSLGSFSYEIDTGTTFTQTTVSGSTIPSGNTTISLSAAPPQPLQVGMGVTGTNVPDNSFIVSIITIRYLDLVLDKEKK